MRALVKKQRTPGLWMEDVPVPKVGPNDVLIKVKKTAICGTDLHIYLWDEWAQRTIPVPMPVGHEFVGEVVDIGGAVDQTACALKIGDRVSGEGHVTCGFCRNCRAGRRHLCPNTQGLGVNRQGCFAEFVTLPAVNAFKIDQSISDDLAAIFDPYGNAVHTTLKYNLVGEDVLITGAGPIGIMAVAIAKHVGARHVVVTDVNDYRLKLARQMGATRAVNVKQEKLKDMMHELDMKEGFDIGLEMSGFGPAFSEMIELMSNGGRIALLGIVPGQHAIDWSRVIFKCLEIQGIYGREMFDTWYKMASLLQSGLDIQKVITHKFPAHDFEKGFTLLRDGNAGKVILDWLA